MNFIDLKRATVKHFCRKVTFYIGAFGVVDVGTGAVVDVDGV